MKKTPRVLPQHTIMIKDDTQKRIIETLVNTPGLHSRELSRQVECPYSTMQYHVNRLKKQGVIQSERQGKYLYHYIGESLGIRERKIISVLRKETTKGILVFLTAHARATQSEISIALQKHQTTVSDILAQLLALGILKTTVLDNNNNDKTVMEKNS